MTPADRHLTQDEIDDLLIGVAGPELRAHCAACVPCWDRVAALSESMDCYSRATLAWSEARSNTFTRDLSGHKLTWRVTGSAMRSIAATLLLGVVASLTAGTHVWPPHSRAAALQAKITPAARASAPDSRAQQIARDNAMLEAIDAELTEPESTSPASFHRAESALTESASVQDRD